MFSRLKCFFSVSCLFFCISSSAYASKFFPLEPPDTSSPRSTLESFIRYTDDLYDAATADEEDETLMREYFQRAVRCFDFSRVPPTLLSDVSVESVLLLREIMDRIQLPAYEDVPDKREARAQNIKLWRIPHTEITIGKAPDGPRMGSYLITPDTVRRLSSFYREVKHMPYKAEKGEDYTGFYEQYIYSSGWMIPDGFLKKLPEWMKEGYLNQALWQWMALFIILGLATLSLWLVLIWHRKLKTKKRNPYKQIDRLIFPFYGMSLCVLVEYISDEQINITGEVLSVLTMGMEFFFALYASVAILVTGNIVMKGIIYSSKIKEEALDADVIKLLCRLVTFGLIFVLFYNVGGAFGIPVTAIFASAGIAGVAVALAARETLANFFGGVSIFMDRPFRAGDYIVLENGERGEVKAVGMRSTRLLTRDDIMITIPNSVITNGKVVNQSMPYSAFRVRIKIGVAYGSDINQVESILMELADSNSLAIPSPEPRVRFRSFGDSSLDFELLCWAARPHDRGRLIHGLNKMIYKKFNEAGIEIPFPQRDVHLHKIGEDNRG